ncbi:hypothetical protein PPTG_19229, partial [Phytophthora nicotianae INRA-310]
MGARYTGKMIQKLTLSLLPLRTSTLSGSAGVKKKVEQELETGELQLRVSDEKAKTALENKISVEIEGAATIINHTLGATLFHE